MVDDFLDGQPDEDLRGVAQKLAALELGHSTMPTA